MCSRFLSIALCLMTVFSSISAVQAGGKRAAWPSSLIKPQAAFNLPYDDQNKAIICTNRPIPPNWVIVGVRHSPGCNGLANNSWVIQRLPDFPGAEVVMCSCQPLPPGWVMIEEVKSCYCGHGMHGIRIRKI